MAVPGNAPADLAATELFAVDAYATEFDARVTDVDEAGARIRLDRTAFYPGAGCRPVSSKVPRSYGCPPPPG